MKSTAQDKLLIGKIFLLMIASGLINTYCVSNFEVPISHHTGNATALAMAIGDGGGVLFYVGILALFFLGSLSCSMLTYGGRIQPGLVAMFILSMIAHFSGGLSIYILVFIFGFQNSLPLHYEGALVRSTHITGYLTDSAVILGRFLRHRDGEHLPIGRFYLISIVFFILGGVSYFYIGQFSLLVVAALYLLLAILWEVGWNL